MSYYHVRINTKSDPRHDVIRLGLSQAELQRRFVEPYDAGTPITTSGQVVDPADIRYIRIHRTDGDASELLSQVRAERQASRVLVLGIPDEWYVAAKGEDVTDDFITRPPGSRTMSPRDARVNTAGPTSSERRAVFVVHGRDLGARDAMFDFLRSLDLRPIEWSYAVGLTGKGSPYVGEVLDAAFAYAQAIIVLMTPDDEVRLADDFLEEGEEDTEGRLTRQARPNVIFEAGMAIAYGESRTVLVELGQLKPFSDVGGRHVIRMNDSSERRQELALRLERAGCAVNRSGSEWLSAGSFVTHPAPQPAVLTSRRYPEDHWGTLLGKRDQLSQTLTVLDPVSLVGRSLSDQLNAGSPESETNVAPDVAHTWLKEHLASDGVWDLLARFERALEAYRGKVDETVGRFVAEAQQQTGLTFAAERGYGPHTEGIRSSLIFSALRLAFDQWRGRPPEPWTAQVEPLKAGEATFVLRLSAAGNDVGAIGTHDQVLHVSRVAEHLYQTAMVSSEVLDAYRQYVTSTTLSEQAVEALNAITEQKLRETQCPGCILLRQREVGTGPTGS